MYIHEDGPINAAEGIIKQARKDFIRAGKKFYEKFGYIPTQKEYNSGRYNNSGNTMADIRYFYDSWQFVIDDPYDMFSGVGADSVIEDWKTASMAECYRKAYVESAAVIYEFRSDLIPTRSGRKKETINDLSNSEIQKLVGNKVADKFIAARDYICSLDQSWRFVDWNRYAADKLRKMKKLQGV